MNKGECIEKHEKCNLFFHCKCHIMEALHTELVFHNQDFVNTKKKCFKGKGVGEWVIDVIKAGLRVKWSETNFKHVTGHQGANQRLACSGELWRFFSSSVFNLIFARISNRKESKQIIYVTNILMLMDLTTGSIASSILKLFPDHVKNILILIQIDTIQERHKWCWLSKQTKEQTSYKISLQKL